MSNSKFTGIRGSPVSEKAFWNAYDRLPPKVRRTLQESVVDWSPLPLFRRWRQGNITEAKLCQMIRRWDRESLKELKRKEQAKNKPRKKARKKTNQLQRAL